MNKDEQKVIITVTKTVRFGEQEITKIAEMALTDEQCNQDGLTRRLTRELMDSLNCQPTPK
jgi:hypothetical protein